MKDSLMHVILSIVGAVLGAAVTIGGYLIVMGKRIARFEVVAETQKKVLGRLDVLEAENVAHREAVADALAKNNIELAKALAANNAELARTLAESNAKIAKALADSNTQVGERLSALETAGKFQAETMAAHSRSLERIEATTILIQKEGCWRASELHGGSRTARKG
jgi:hypothetical protein